VEYARKPRSEQFADCFAASFLMPAAGLRQRFRSVLKSRDDFTVADLCWLASRYGVSVEAMTRRLESLGCLQRGMWDRLSADGFQPGEAQQRLGLSSPRVPSVRLPERYRRLAVQAFEDEKITESELMRFLRCSRVEAREAVEAMTQSREIDDRTGVAYQLSLEFAEPLDVAAAERE
jgi:Zn-dependent peptidase ImmA (M78 family)